MIRCELSLDGGETWRRAEIERAEAPTPHNKTWCWVFWSVAVSAVELLRAPELRIRAVDSSQNMMPEKCALSGAIAGQDCGVSDYGPHAARVVQPHMMRLRTHLPWQDSQHRQVAVALGYGNFVRHTIVRDAGHGLKLTSCVPRAGQADLEPDGHDE